MVKGLLNIIPDDMSFKDMTCNHKCSGCGSCCTSMLPITKKELSILKDYIKEHNIKGSFLSGYDEKNIYAFCPLLDPVTNKCRVYPVRPYACRNFKCDKNKEQLKKEREMYAKRADFNAFIYNKPSASMQLLLFGDSQYDITYRHLLIKNFINQYPEAKLKFGNDISFEMEQKIMPMYVDKFIKKGGE